MKRLAWLLAAAVTSVAASAGATERQHAVGVDLGMSALKVDDKSTLSVCCGLGAHYSYGLTDAFNFMAEAEWSIVSFGETLAKDTPRTRPTMMGHAAAGVGYVFDVLTYVPYAGVLVGPTLMTGGTLESAKVLPAGELALGLDYKLSHTWSVGVAFRQQVMLAQTSTYPSYTNVFARMEYVWGF